MGIQKKYKLIFYSGTTLTLFLAAKLVKELASSYGYAFADTPMVRLLKPVDEQKYSHMYCNIDTEKKAIRLAFSSKRDPEEWQDSENYYYKYVIKIHNILAGRDPNIWHQEDGMDDHHFREIFNTNGYLGRGGLQYSTARERTYREASRNFQDSVKGNEGVEFVFISGNHNLIRDGLRTAPGTPFSGTLVKRAYLEEILGCKYDDIKTIFKPYTNSLRYPSGLLYIGGHTIYDADLIQMSDISTDTLISMIDKVDYSIYIGQYNSYYVPQVKRIDGEFFVEIYASPTREELLEASTFDNMLIMNVFSAPLDRPGVMTKSQIVKQNSNIKIITQ